MHKFFSMLVVVLMCGCAHYHTGTGSQLPFQNVYIAPALNDSFAPQAQALITNQIRKKILNDARISLAKNSDQADATLDITLVDFRTAIGATKEHDSISAQTFNVTLDVKITLTDSSNKVLIDRQNVSASVNVPTDGDYEETQYQTMPKLTQKIADKIYTLISTPW